MSYKQNSPQGVEEGGTGATTLTDHGILLGSGTGAITATAAPTNGQLLIGSTGIDPVVANLTGGTGITVTNGAGTITIDADNNGDVSGPGSSTDNAVARWDGTGGETLQNSSVTIDDSGNIDANSIAFSSGDQLSQYDEGTWTPSLEFGGATTGITYSVQSGNYVRIGSIVYVDCTIALTSKGSATGVASLAGLPFSSTTMTAQIALTAVSGITYSGNEVFMLTTGSSTSLRFFTGSSGGSAAQLSDTGFTNASDFRVNGTYRI